MCKSLVGSASSPSLHPLAFLSGIRGCPAAHLIRSNVLRHVKMPGLVCLVWEGWPVVSPEASENQNMLSPDVLLSGLKSRGLIAAAEGSELCKCSHLRDQDTCSPYASWFSAQLCPHLELSVVSPPVCCVSAEDTSSLGLQDKRRKFWGRGGHLWLSLVTDWSAVPISFCAAMVRQGWEPFC